MFPLRTRAPLIFLIPALLPFTALAGGGGGHSSVIRNIALSMVAASALGLAMKALRQPLLLGYMLGGALVGPIGLGLVTERAEIETLSEIGLILLLFMIGLEIDLKKMLRAGRLVIVTGVLQVPLTLAVGYGLFAGLTALGLNFGGGKYALLYVAVAISISSTMIVIKLLYDKLELDTLSGRITVGILVFQDIWAIILLAVQPNLADPRVLGLLRTFGAGALLVVAALAISRWVLPHLFHLVAKVPEMMVVLSLGWCFAVGLVAAHPAVGLSMEMGALIAGVSLATFPYNLDVIAKVINIRDFFITLFFVSLGMQIPLPTVPMIAVALSVCGVLLLARILAVFGVLNGLRAGHWSSILPAINLAQMSEFSLVILAMGVGHGHIGQDTLSVALWSFALMAVASTYLIGSSHALERFFSRVLTGLGFQDLAGKEADEKTERAPKVVFLGFFRIARAFLHEVQRRDQHLVEEMLVVDFNPEVRSELTSLGIPVVYGDIGHPDTLHHAKIEAAEVVISTVPDSALRGTSNLKLLKMARELCPDARVIVTAERQEEARELYREGADFVLRPNHLAGVSLVTAVEQALRGSCEGMREEAEQRLQETAAPMASPEDKPRAA